MKWSYIVLLVLGVVAALSAAVLVHSLRLQRRERERREEVNVMCAAKTLQAMTIIDSSCVTSKTIRKDEMPAGSLTDSVHVVGKILIVPMLEGQVFTEQCIASEGVGLQLASALPVGMRAVTIHLPDDASLGGILYPGNVVDVLAMFDLPSPAGSANTTVSTVLVTGVQVLAIEDETITTGGGRTLGTPPAQRRGPRMVTLMVDSADAQALQLAESRGEVLLALRNPKDAAPPDEDPAYLSDLYAQHTPPGLGLVEVPGEAPPTGRWHVVIIRGADIQTQELTVPPKADADENR